MVPSLAREVRHDADHALNPHHLAAIVHLVLFSHSNTSKRLVVKATVHAGIVTVSTTYFSSFERSSFTSARAFVMGTRNRTSVVNP